MKFFSIQNCQTPTLQPGSKAHQHSLALRLLALLILLLPLGLNTVWAQTTYRFDYTYKVGTDQTSWHGTNVAATTVAPAVATANGLTVQMAERYENNTTTNNGNNDNGKLYQEVTGLPNGTYEVKLYAKFMW